MMVVDQTEGSQERLSKAKDQKEMHEANQAALASYLEELLDQQQELTAVEEFSARHQTAELPHVGIYQKLLPATPPGPDEQYAFEVELDSCTGCKACVVACHSQNGLDDGESWRSVGLLLGGTEELPVLQHVTHSCHHCLEPACSIGCPVNAYTKDAKTGIVKHLDDQCIGCQYCTLACPYDVPRYHHGHGIVRKCDMCAQRLAVNEPPACAQACPNGAIKIRTVVVSRVRRDAEANMFLPGAAPPQFTLPTTIYKSRRPLPQNVLPADYYDVNPQHGHPALAAMLVLTQGSVGAMVGRQILTGILGETETPILIWSALFLGFLGIFASIFHLGRPLYAYRSILNLRRSWLSREILAFGLFAGSASAMAASHFAGFPLSLTNGFGWLTTIIGVLAVFCSAMIYVYVGRPQWNFLTVNGKFFLSAIWLGFPLAAIFARETSAGSLLLTVAIFAATLKLAIEAAAFLPLASRHKSPAKRSAQLMLGPLFAGTIVRWGTGLLAVSMLNAGWSNPTNLMLPVLLATGLALAGELAERMLFFLAAVDFRMPGSIRA